MLFFHWKYKGFSNGRPWENIYNIALIWEGSGTTLVIAQDLGIDSIGIDINPHAALFSYVKTNVYDRDKMKRYYFLIWK